MKCAFEMGSGGTINVRSFVMIGEGVKGILRFCLINMKTVMLVLLVLGVYVSRH
jgi:hypothetical protein